MAATKEQISHELQQKRQAYAQQKQAMEIVTAIIAQDTKKFIDAKKALAEKKIMLDAAKAAWKTAHTAMLAYVDENNENLERLNAVYNESSRDLPPALAALEEGIAQNIPEQALAPLRQAELLALDKRIEVDNLIEEEVAILNQYIREDEAKEAIYKSLSLDYKQDRNKVRELEKKIDRAHQAQKNISQKLIDTQRCIDRLTATLTAFEVKAQQTVSEIPPSSTASVLPDPAPKAAGAAMLPMAALKAKKQAGSFPGICKQKLRLPCTIV